MKKIIYFDDINLFNRCAVEATKVGLISAEDFIANSVEKYFVKKYAEKNIEKSYKKPLELWIECENEAHKVIGMTVAELIEAIVRLEIEGTTIQVIKMDNEVRKKGIIEGIKSAAHAVNEAMRLPAG